MVAQLCAGAIVLGVAVAAAATALAGSAAVRVSGGQVDAVNVAYDAIAGVQTGSTRWTRVITAGFTVPADTSPFILVRYTAEADCHSRFASSPTCRVRFRLRKVRVPDDPSLSPFDWATVRATVLAQPTVNNHFGVETTEFIHGPLEPGDYVLDVEGRTNSDVDATFFRQLLVVEQVRGTGAPDVRPRPIAETRAATAPAFDSSEATGTWQTLASTRVTVPTGQTNLLLARFSAGSRCAKPDTLVDLLPAKPCELVIRFRRITADGVQSVSTLPDRAIRFDDTGDDRTFRAQRAEAVSGPVRAGTYEILVRASESMDWQLRSPLLTVDRVNLVVGAGLAVDG